VCVGAAPAESRSALAWNVNKLQELVRNSFPWLRQKTWRRLLGPISDRMFFIGHAFVACAFLSGAAVVVVVVLSSYSAHVTRDAQGQGTFEFEGMRCPRSPM